MINTETIMAEMLAAYLRDIFYTCYIESIDHRIFVTQYGANMFMIHVSDNNIEIRTLGSDRAEFQYYDITNPNYDPMSTFNNIVDFISGKVEVIRYFMRWTNNVSILPRRTETGCT